MRRAARQRRGCVAAFAAGLFVVLPLRAGVVISEIHYNPCASGDISLQFVEIANDGAAAVDLSGWSFTGAIAFVFPGGAVLAPGAVAVAARDAARLAARFDVPPGALYGEFSGRLECGGGQLVLRNAHNAIMDAVRFHGQEPWPPEAGGGGASLVRRCTREPAYRGAAWRAGSPTPGTAIVPGECPLEPHEPAPVVINEIHYRPPGRREDEAFVELHNPTALPVDLSGWGLRGARFDFPEGSVIAPGGYLLVCRNPDRITQLHGPVAVAGPFAGRLSMRGERLALYDAGGHLVDVVFYEDGTDGTWPSLPDGGGFSLERIAVGASGEDPANWSAARTPGDDAFQEAEALGSRLVPGERWVTLFLPAQGEYLVDDVVLEDVEAPGVNLIANGSFDTGLSGWTVSPGGMHAASSWAPGEGVGGSGALRLVALRDCTLQCSRFDAVYARTTSLLREATYRLRFKYRHVRGGAGIVCDLEGRVTARAGLGGVLSPGRANGAADDEPPPFLVGLGRFPQAPTPDDAPYVTAAVRGVGASGTVVLRMVAGAGSVPVDYPMHDGGRDGDAGNGVWGVQLPPRPHGTAVMFTIAITDARGRTAVFPARGETSATFGYYVDGTRTASALPVYQLLLPGLTGADPAAVNQHLSCTAYRRGHFVFEGELYPDVAVRNRGFTGCFLPKRHFKIRFNQGRHFQGLRRINLNSMWTDKALIREHLAWEFIRDIGAMHCETAFTRLHINGEYYGLYLYLEHPDQRFLARNGRDAGGDLFKAEMGPYGAGTCSWTPGLHRYGTLSEYAAYWERETNKDDGFEPLLDFVGGLHDSGGDPGFFQDRVDIESVILFQIGQVALRNYDSDTKNHFLLRDPETDRWSFLPWDQDLCLGKFFDPEAVGPGRPVGTLNDRMSCPLFPALLMRQAQLTGCGFPSNWLLHYFFNAGVDQYHRAYYVRFWSILQEKFTGDAFHARVDALHALLAGEAAEDLARWGRYPSNLPVGSAPPDDLAVHLDILKAQFDCHRGQLAALLPQELRAHPRLRITELFVASDDDGDRLQFVELHNPDAAPVDAGGWSIDGIGFTFPAGTVVPPGGLAVVARDPDAFEQAYGFRPLGPFAGRLDGNGQTLRVYDAGRGGDHPAVVDYLRFENGGAWPDLWRGYSMELTAWGAHVDNDRGELWARSAVPGGTPGVRHGGDVAFRRGDVDQNGRVQIGDAIGIAWYLFGGGDEPACLDAADGNSDGRLDISDVVYLLAYLFAGGPEPPPPFHACGYDMVRSLGCAVFTPCAAP